MNSIDFNGHIFDVCHFTVSVTSLNIRPPIFPVTLRADNGKEHIIRSVRIPTFGCSKGNKLKVIWVEIPKDLSHMNGNTLYDSTLVGDKRIIYLATKNFTTDEVLIHDDLLGQLYSASHKTAGCLTFLAVLLSIWFGIFFFGAILEIKYFNFIFKSLTISFVISVAVAVFISIPSYKSSIKADEFVLETKRNLLLML